ncbi:MAG: hypothetical protein IPP88_09025 [Betaproteobacteria bacterium]|nr:hypothetical protein [Betaproteobacteria bacterium]
MANPLPVPTLAAGIAAAAVRPIMSQKPIATSINRTPGAADARWGCIKFSSVPLLTMSCLSR